MLLHAWQKLKNNYLFIYVEGSELFLQMLKQGSFHPQTELQKQVQHSNAKLPHMGQQCKITVKRRLQLADRSLQIRVCRLEFALRSLQIRIRRSEFADWSLQLGVRGSESTDRSSRIGVYGSEFADRSSQITESIAVQDALCKLEKTIFVT